jgi:putative nucleotidyltransferase with HDIG domain
VAASLAVPDRVVAILERLWSNGHAAYLVGGAVRGLLLSGSFPADDLADVATDARPERLLELFPEGRYENRFGTVVLPGQAEITTFRRDHRYADHRRPEAVTFTDDLLEDLARRDFTVNAIAWGRPADRPGSPSPEPAIVDPAGGMADLDARLLRAVGDPRARFDEDALRLLRAARFAAQLGFAVEPATQAQMREQAGVAAHVSRERVGQELGRLLDAPEPSRGLRVLDETGLLDILLPELAAERGVTQNKPLGSDLWEHTVATVDAAAGIAQGDRRLAYAALLHDVGKPATREVAFRGHETVGAGIAGAILERLAVARREAEPIVRLVAGHMFGYRPEWSDAAVRRFLRAIGPELSEDLFRLRRADNVGSGWPETAGGIDELERRARDQLTLGVPLRTGDLAIDGTDIQAELGIPAGPLIGRLLDRLLESVIADPRRNTRRQLLSDARTWAAAMTEPAPEGRKPA